MEVLIIWMPTVFSLLTGILIAGSIFNIIQSTQTMMSVCRLRKYQPISKRIRKGDVFQLAGGLLVTAVLSFILFYPLTFVSNFMQHIILAEIVYAMFLFNVSERSFKCCDMIYKKTTPH